MSKGPATVRGFAWFVFPDPSRDELSFAISPLRSTMPYAHLWWVDGSEQGIRNPIWGDTYLIVTETPDLPRLEPGWSIEPADLDDCFESDDGAVRLTRLVGNRRTPWGIVQECEFAAMSTGAAPRETLPRPQSGLYDRFR